MKILYIFPHPDDESFGPSRAISKQIREGHQVHLLTLTKGGATKERHKFGYSIKEMGEVRHRELSCVAETLGLSSLTVCDFPDGGLKEIDPRELEAQIQTSINSIKPEVVVTYAVHGISGHPDHLVTHAIVKRAYIQLKQSDTTLKRLAFYTVPEPQNKPKYRAPRYTFSYPEEIDCIIEVEEIDKENFLTALACYKTYQERINRAGIKKSKNRSVYFEFFLESFSPPIGGLFSSLP